MVRIGGLLVVTGFLHFAVGRHLAGAGIAARQTGEWALTLQQPVAVATLPGFFAGLVSVQDLGAQFAAPGLGAVDGERVLALTAWKAATEAAVKRHAVICREWAAGAPRA